MTIPVVTVHPSATLAEAAELMLERRIGSVVVVDPADETRIVGIVTETDLTLREERVPFSYPLTRAQKLFDRWVDSSQTFERAYREWCRRPVESVMRSSVHTVAAEADVWEAAARMVEHDVKRLPVVDEGRLVGLVARHDLLRCLAPASTAG